MSLGHFILCLLIAKGIIALTGMVVPFLVPIVSIVLIAGIMMLHWGIEQAENQERINREKKEREKMRARLQLDEPDVF
jgi:hypothetical protein